MQLRLLGTESGKEGCPALYATDRGTYVVQGKRITDPEAIRKPSPGWLTFGRTSSMWRSPLGCSVTLRGDG